MSRRLSTKTTLIVAVVIILMIIGALSGPDDDASNGATSRTTMAAPVTTAPLATAVPETSTLAPTTTVAVTTTTNAPPATHHPAPSGPTINEVRQRLATLPVKGRAPKTGYKRDQFGPSWTDDVTVAGGHNGCDTRNDILRRDLTAIETKPNTRECVIARGVLADPYTGKTINFTRGVRTSIAVQIDHVVALSDAWQKGAQQLTAAQRVNFANDPANLLAVDGPTNAQKGDGDTATWLPPNKSFRCRYVALQVNVKYRYHLWVTAAERDAMSRNLANCTDAQIGRLP